MVRFPGSLLDQAIADVNLEMELKKLHMGTMSYGFDSMDEVAHQLGIAFGAKEGPCLTEFSLWKASRYVNPTFRSSSCGVNCDRCPARYARKAGDVCSVEGRRAYSGIVSQRTSLVLHMHHCLLLSCMPNR